MLARNAGPSVSCLYEVLGSGAAEVVLVGAVTGDGAEATTVKAARLRRDAFPISDLDARSDDGDDVLERQRAEPRNKRDAMANFRGVKFILR